MPQVRYTSNGDMYLIPDEVPSNSLYPTNTTLNPTNENYNNDLAEYAKQLPFAVDMQPLPTHNDYPGRTQDLKNEQYAKWKEENPLVLFPGLRDGIKTLKDNPLSTPQQMFDKLTGSNNTERYQLWPETMTKSAVTLPGDVASGKVPTPFSIPGTQSSDESPDDALIQRAQDLAGLAGGATLGVKPGVASVGSGMVRKGLTEELSPLGVKAKEHFGLTNNPKEVGYVLPDGSMLDLSGRHYDGSFQRVNGVNVPPVGKRDYLKDQRQTDHRELDFFDSPVNQVTGGADQVLKMMHFMNESGAARNFPGIGFEVSKLPTDLQLRKIIGGHNSTYRGEPLNVDVSLPSGEVKASKTFDKPNVETVKKWIESSLVTDSGKAGAPLSALEKAPVFYSAVENAVKNAKQPVASADQWLGYLRNQPGVKAEELEYVLNDLPKGQITKAELEDYVAAHKVELKEVSKGKKSYEQLSEEYEQLNPKPDKLKNYDAYANWKAQRDTWIDKELDKNLEPKFSQWQLPGGENYKEMLLTLPENISKAKQGFEAFHKEIIDKYNGNFNKMTKEEKSKMEGLASESIAAPLVDNFTSSHWDEPNVLAHVRMNDRIVGSTPTIEYLTKAAEKAANDNRLSNNSMAFLIEHLKEQGLKEGVDFKINLGKDKKTLHLEEIQSDWHQKGRKEGYKLSDKQKSELDRIEEKLVSSNDESVLGHPEINEAVKMAVDKKIITPEEGKNYIEYTKGADSAIPDAPFKKSWADLALKRMIRHAAENGYDALSWTPGEAQAARYDLSKQISKITYNVPGSKLADKYGTVLKAFDHSGNEVINKALKPEELADTIGKETAEKLLKTEKNKDKHELSGIDLKVGGEGMQAFYDKMLVDKANALVKKYGGKVEQRHIPATEKGKLEELADNRWVIRHNTGSSRIYNTKAEAEAALTQPIHYLELPKELKDTALHKGFPLFSSGFMLTPVTDDKRFKFTPVDKIP